MDEKQKQLQKQIIDDLKVQPKIDPETEIRRSVDFIKNYVQKNSFIKSVVLGISGGQDSTLTGKLAAMAINELREETGDTEYQFIAVRLPYGEQSDESDAMEAIDFMDADRVERVNIKASVDSMVKAVEANGDSISDFNKGNIKARTRMIAQFTIAGANQGIVLGTDHAAEAVTGFYTKFGDGASDIVPIWRLDKRQGRALLEYLGAPKHLYEKTPTADLEDDRPSLPDEKALGVSYKNIDDFLEGKDISSDAAQVIENWYLKTQHKRHLPINVYDTFWK
ncbi:ammonia-dependent NAD(+) synthetase [Fructilactobacillus fructivorans]|uniref:NH(3)-dependent NAD(+) synthetase n=1 Tax=Fructilactobacillus fructivorans TaxID=1614 RepID=A0A0C1PPC9_9LACO|nr:ammonia-dependent NAD(+) synthetase [Fructilactobacillus fructivorans]KID41731.1 NAD synthetase [Fructilactobacillus fructivorans]MCT0151384.1 ammonia-dependent NAD(+) synthetase [Fructilactobacillus fructivorans]MCT2867539.1 ammonia-dependent NAD(+) synthetase [Fructilactobacillus fructivorans]MCT2868943.1 ammonia-dependent NAD(+) synthetase [Fructilactobacillus fructivorans]MCT2873887.1 ammonia-dependent NAD(+) synthetase [Fructilactobacillus fructivorans]